MQLYDRYKEDREAIGRKLADERGMTLIPPFDHPQVMAGQGTAALELIEDAGPFDVLLVCVGGGGLISGCAVATKHALPRCNVVGVEPEAGNDVQQSLRRGEIVHIDVPRDDCRRRTNAGARTFHLSGDSSAGRRRADGDRSTARFNDALFCRANEDGGRADRVPGGGRGA